MSPVSNFTFDDRNYFVLNTAYIMTGKSLKYLVSIINSKILDTYFAFISTDVRGQTRRYIKQYVELLPIPKIAPEKQLPFEVLVDCVLFAKEHGLDQEALLLESVIDGMVFDLYFLDNMKKAECYITDRVSGIVKPFKTSDTVSFKTEYVMKLCEFCRKDEVIYHGLIFRRTIDVVRAVMGENNE
jgi:hypothetical protein